MYNFKVAIDGPTGAGKSTISAEVAKRIGCVYVDTGAMYRAVGLYVRRKGVSSEDAAAIIGLLDEIKVTISHDAGGQRIILNGEDVSGEIRTPEASVYASNVSKIPQVRAALLQLQRDLASRESVLMDGRDIGTVILPDADVKIFLTASDEERARRRYEELAGKGGKVTYDEVLTDLRWRDKNDSGRAAAPLMAADDAVTVDTTGNEFEASVEAITRVIYDGLVKKHGTAPFGVNN
ncbi:MAG: (d)CMP kinase [Oscillospiraceae bacterium]|jgi:cytidylate kinase|nr:(d)CMP kinase [Oscillospiraceae bacterium]